MKILTSQTVSFLVQYLTSKLVIIALISMFFMQLAIFSVLSRLQPDMFATI